MMVRQLRPMVQISSEYLELLQQLENQRQAQQGLFAPGIRGENLLPVIQAQILAGGPPGGPGA